MESGCAAEIKQVEGTAYLQTPSEKIIGFYSQEALLRILDTTADNLLAFADGDRVLGIIESSKWRLK